VEQRLAASENRSDRCDVRESLAHLTQYHDTQTRNFQHERLIHLLVTFFFGGLLIAALVGIGLYLATGHDLDPWITGALAGLCLVLLGLEIAYIGHYYKLENNVQALYGLTARLFQVWVRAEDGNVTDDQVGTDRIT
jgi:hypothetical protein